MRGSERDRLPNSDNKIVVPPYTGGDNASRVARHTRKREADAHSEQRMMRPRTELFTLRELSEQVEDQMAAFMPEAALIDRQASDNFEIIKLALSELNLPHAILFNLTEEEVSDTLENAHDKIAELSNTLDLDLETLSFLFLHDDETQRLILYSIATDQILVEIALEEEYFESSHVLLESLLFHLEQYDIELRPTLSEQRQVANDELAAMFNTTQVARHQAERAEQEHGIAVEKKEEKKQRRKTKKKRNKRKRR